MRWITAILVFLVSTASAEEAKNARVIVLGCDTREQMMEVLVAGRKSFSDFDRAYWGYALKANQRAQSVCIFYTTFLDSVLHGEKEMVQGVEYRPGKRADFLVSQVDAGWVAFTPGLTFVFTPETPS